MTHPDFAALTSGETLEQRIVRDVIEHRRAELACIACLDPTAEPCGKQLQAVADAEQGHAEFEDPVIEVRRAGFVHTRGPAGQDDAGRRKGADVVERHPVGVDLAVDLMLAHPSRDQLRHLRSVIEDQDLVRCGGGRLGHQRSGSSSA